MASAWAPASMRSGSLAAAEQPKNLDRNMDRGVSDPLFRWLLRIRPPTNEVVIAAAAISVRSAAVARPRPALARRAHVSLRRTRGRTRQDQPQGQTDLHAAKLGKVADASPICARARFSGSLARCSWSEQSSALKR
jgi:hypothetical protein